MPMTTSSCARPARVARRSVRVDQRGVVRGDHRADRRFGEPRHRCNHFGQSPHPAARSRAIVCSITRAAARAPPPPARRDRRRRRPARASASRQSNGAPSGRVEPAALVRMRGQRRGGVAAVGEGGGEVHRGSVARKVWAGRGRGGRTKAGPAAGRAGPEAGGRRASLQCATGRPLCPPRAPPQAPSAHPDRRSGARILRAARVARRRDRGRVRARRCSRSASSSSRRSRASASASRRCCRRSCGQPVEIGGIATGWDGWNPKLVLTNFPRARPRSGRARRRCSSCRRSTSRWRGPRCR